MENIPALFQSIAKLKVAVIGDVMLDTYLLGSVERISPEAPVPVIALREEENRMGGAANVALNVAALGASVSLLSVVGNDKEADLLAGLLQKAGIDNRYLLKDSSRPTTTKTRIISRSQHMLRVDREVTRELDPPVEKAFLKQVEQFIAQEKPDVLIFEDYDKGVLTPTVISKTLSLCRSKKICTAVDPKKEHFFNYKGVNLFKPNWKEVREGLNLLSARADIDSLTAIHRQLEQRLNHQFSLITLSEKGVFYALQHEQGIIPSHRRAISDVSGAGDTVIAVASLVYRVTANPYLTAELSNIAGGLVCETVGTVPINKQALEQEAELLLS